MGKNPFVPHGLAEGRPTRPQPLCAPQQISAANVRFGSKADIGEDAIDVRFTPKSRHWFSVLECPLCAKSGKSARLYGQSTGVSVKGG
jgi:hypothetical protein